ncbi:hypothetical protein TRAPUB_5024 [Trametes pubescens]|uniref:Uncharacterized protein n=1 Tax=Trametes pubescens TaxID=154538 RepID=A0A1M2V9E6_TRAPU|nr:hypothetical protein TRAPUB_5024 [Trametes pubescens]
MSTSEDQGSDVECDDHVKSPELPSLRVSSTSHLTKGFGFTISYQFALLTVAFEQDTSPSLKLSVPVGDAELALDAPSSECK